MKARGRTVIIFASLVVLVAVVLGGWFSLRGTDDSVASPPPVTTQFICPMHPQIIQDGPGTCPICHMDLVPATREEEPATPDPTHADHETPEGLAQVRIPQVQARRIGARSVPVALSRFERVVRAAGRVAVDESRLRQVHTKTAGWVERLWANAEGERVRRGAPLLEIYSPELLAAQEEFLVALRARGHLEGSAMGEVADAGRSLVDAARRRLRLLELSDEAIATLETSGQTQRTVVVSSPISGTILTREISQGARVEPGTMLLQVADLSTVWILASVYEHELPFVREGQEATVTLAYLPGRTLSGRVARVYPTLDPATRTATVRVELANPEGSLRPEMFAEVELRADLGERLAVPNEAVMETGLRSVVYVDDGAGLFSPRAIEIGLRLPDRAEVVSGLVAGERVLAQGNFFIDAESRLRSGLAAAAGDGPAGKHDHQP